MLLVLFVGIGQFKNGSWGNSCGCQSSQKIVLCSVLLLKRVQFFHLGPMCSKTQKTGLLSVAYTLEPPLRVCNYAG